MDPRARRFSRAIATLVAIATLAATAAACGGDDPRPAVVGRVPTTTAPAPTTTVAPAPADAKALVTPSGVVVPVIAVDDAGRWNVRTPCNRTATIADGTPVSHVDIVLDPGHGGAELGAVSPDGLREATVNLGVSQQAKGALEAAGYTVLLTRTADYELFLPPRAEIARALQPRAFVSIHHNTVPDGPRPGPGSETFYQIASADSKRLAGLLYEEIVRALSAYDIPWVSDTDAGAKYRQGQQGGDYYAVLRRPGAVVSVLTEAAFISNRAEAELLARPDVQKVEGEAVARAIVRYLTTDDPGSGFTEPYPRTEPPDDSVPHVCQDPPF